MDDEAKRRVWQLLPVRRERLQALTPAQAPEQAR
jgi:hypothetical protein